MLNGFVLCLALLPAADPDPVPANEAPTVAAEPSLAAPVAGQPLSEQPLAQAPTDLAALTARIDECVARHWSLLGVQQAPACSDAAFLRRVWLDLAGYVPSGRDLGEFLANNSADKRARAVARLQASPEYPRHLSNVLDEMIQGKRAGDADFVAYLRDAVEGRTGWDQIFRDVVLGPCDSPERKRADRFLARRLSNLDELTNDTSRVFFGVDISCAKCHDHPLVDDWKQDHFYGMAAFFQRTFEFKGQEALVGERDSGDLEFVRLDGEKRIASLMFLSGQTVPEPALPADPARDQQKEQAEKDGKYLPPPFSRREQLVRLALEDRRMLSRAVANRMWAWLMGRGLVHPVDQMHSANAPSIEGLLEILSEDFAASNFDLHRLIAGIAASRVYQLDSEWASDVPRPQLEQFAVAAPRPLTPRQYAMSMIVALGDASLARIVDPAARRDRYQQLENQAQETIEWLDARTDGFQSSTTEALFLSNHAAIGQLVQPGGDNLPARLLDLADSGLLVDTAVWTVLGRQPALDERQYLVDWIDARQADRPRACRDLLWALCTSAEFRFNH